MFNYRIIRKAYVDGHVSYFIKKRTWFLFWFYIEGSNAPDEAHRLEFDSEEKAVDWIVEKAFRVVDKFMKESVVKSEVVKEL